MAITALEVKEDGQVWLIPDLPITAKKKEVYKYAVEFIKWYNRQSK